MAHDEIQLEGSLETDHMRSLSAAKTASLRNSNDGVGANEQLSTNVTDIVHYRVYKRRYAGLIGFVSVQL